MHPLDYVLSGDAYEVACRIVANHPRDLATRWYVITGAPSSGKTTLINQLALTGYRTNPDMSRQLLEDYRRLGIPAISVKQDQAAFQRRLFALMVENSIKLPTDETIIHDYALPENIAFWKNARLNVPDPILQSARMFRFRGVFICEPLALAVDGIRTETSQDQENLFKMIVECYRELGYQPHLIPADTVQARLSMILKHLPPSP